MSTDMLCTSHISKHLSFSITQFAQVDNRWLFSAW